MERRVALSIREADTAEAKLELMDGVMNKLKASIKILVCIKIFLKPVLFKTCIGKEDV